ncbi:MAG: hypothetical protein KF729_04305 [Sandaracinaceae bacterium]|nr:hypothetical protein [Sandaracinaceae bacterium]
MGVASIVLGVLAAILAFAGAMLTWVPFLGALLSFLSPVLALVGAVLGGVALSRAKEEGGESGVPLAGLIVSIIAFFPALLVALTCGVCNSMCSAGTLAPRPDSTTSPAFWLVDGGVASPGISPPPVSPDPSFPLPPPTDEPDPSADPSAPPPAFPPPEPVGS